jgi:hypothetical protein
VIDDDIDIDIDIVVVHHRTTTSKKEEREFPTIAMILSHASRKLNVRYNVTSMINPGFHLSRLTCSRLTRSTSRTSPQGQNHGSHTVPVPGTQWPNHPLFKGWLSLMTF